MSVINEMRFWIDKVIELNEASQDVLNIKEFSPNSNNWNYIKENIKQLWEFLNNGYKRAGYEKFCGCDNYRSLLRNANLIKIGFCDGVWVAVSVYTGYRGGFKNVGITATVDENLRSQGVKIVHNIIKTDIGNFKNFFWSECSGAVERLYEKYNGIKIPNEYVSTILQKVIIPEEDGFHYLRDIKGDMQRKIMYGFNDKDTFEKILKEREEYINNCISHILSNRIDESVEQPSFGKLGEIDCAIAVINFFVDETWENECYDFPKESLQTLQKYVNLLKNKMDKNAVPDDMIQNVQLAIENGINIIETANIMTIYAF